MLACLALLAPRRRAGGARPSRHGNSHPDPDDDRFSFSGSFELPTAWAFTDLDPSASAVRILVRTPSGGTGLDVALPAGLRSPGLRRGWVRKGNGKVWSHSDRDPTPSAASSRRRSPDPPIREGTR